MIEALPGREPVFTVREVAAYARVSPETVRYWLKTRRLRSVMIGGSRRIPASALDELIRSSATRTPAVDPADAAALAEAYALLGRIASRPD